MPWRRDASPNVGCEKGVDMILDGRTIQRGMAILLWLMISGCHHGSEVVHIDGTTGAEVLGEEGIGPDVAGNGYFITRNNSARLLGDSLGTGEIDNRDLRKIVRVDLRAAGSELMVGQAYVARFALGSENIRAIIPVKNTSARLRCFLALKSIIFTAGDGRSLAVDDKDFVEGSVGRSRSSTNTCLAPGEIGYALMEVLAEPGGQRLFSSLDHVEIVGFEESSEAFIPASVRVLPTHYEVVDPATRDYTVTIENQGASRVQIDPLGLSVVLLDEQGRPLDWDFLRIPSEQETGFGTVLGAGQTMNLIAVTRFKGVSSHIRAIVNFDQVAGTPRAGR